eukprot:gene132-5496_t
MLVDLAEVWSRSDTRCPLVPDFSAAGQWRAWLLPGPEFQCFWADPWDCLSSSSWWAVACMVASWSRISVLLGSGVHGYQLVPDFSATGAILGTVRPAPGDEQWSAWLPAGPGFQRCRADPWGCPTRSSCWAMASMAAPCGAHGYQLIPDFSATGAILGTVRPACMAASWSRISALQGRSLGLSNQKLLLGNGVHGCPLVPVSLLLN